MAVVNDDDEEFYSSAAMRMGVKVTWMLRLFFLRASAVTVVLPCCVALLSLVALRDFLALLDAALLLPLLSYRISSNDALFCDKEELPSRSTLYDADVGMLRRHL